MFRWIMICCLGVVSVFTAVADDRIYGWPQLKAPEGLIVCTAVQDKAEMMLLESLSGLAARAVNEGRFDKMVWITTGNRSYERIFEASKAALNMEDISYMDVWQLLEYLQKEHVVKGYVVYGLEKEQGKIIKDYSSNVATVYAALTGGAMFDVSIEDEARRRGLRKLKDARTETTLECFHKNRHLLKNVSALSIHPAVANMRDYAIAHSLMLYADETQLMDEVLQWVEPLSPIVGWGCGDEFEHTKKVSEWGHYNTASDWCTNLPFISAAAPYIRLQKAAETALSAIDFSDSSYVHAFLMSDGDNMQWTMGGFADNPLYMGHPDSGHAGMNWTACPVNLSVVSPVSWNEIVSRQNGNTLVEYGGDISILTCLRLSAKTREVLLRAFARRLNHYLRKTGVKVFGVICENVESEKAREAFQVYAEELTDITGMIAIQYFPYELGKKVFWFTDRNGEHVPVLTAAFSLWNEVSSKRPFCGTPEYVASLINRDKALSSAGQSYSWTIVHAWSDFSETSKLTSRPAVGVNPVLAASRLLDDGIRLVPLDEMMWRIRMRFYPEEVRRRINADN